MKQAIVVYDNGIHDPVYFEGYNKKGNALWTKQKAHAIVISLPDAKTIVNNYNYSVKKSTHYGVIILDNSIGTVDKTDPTKAYDRAMRGI